MFRLLSRQAVKAIPRPFRLFSGTASRHVHSMEAPYTGPPSYDTIARRFSSSEVDPQSYFIRKHQQEAKERGEYIDIHDIGGVDPEDYDVLISDVNDEKLRSEVAEVVGLPYHAEATKEDASKAVEIGDCYILGRRFRTIFPVVVGIGTRAHWVFFIVDTGSPLTYLSAQTSALFDISEESGPNLIRIGGHKTPVYRSPANSRFTELNLLGMDFHHYYNISQVNDFKKRRAKLYFGQKWRMVEDDSV